MKHRVESESPGIYTTGRPYSEAGLVAAVANGIAAQAELMKAHSARLDTDQIQSPKAMKDLAILAIANEPTENFIGLFFDAAYRLIAWEVLATGTIDSAAVYPREVVKAALRLDARAVAFAHNHPSGNLQPSPADRTLTNLLRDALNTIGVTTLDHIIVGRGSVLAYSMAERGDL